RRSARPDRRGRGHRGDGVRPASAGLDPRLVHELAGPDPSAARHPIPAAVSARRLSAGVLPRGATGPGGPAHRETPAEPPGTPAAGAAARSGAGRTRAAVAVRLSRWTVNRGCV